MTAEHDSPETIIEAVREWQEAESRVFEAQKMYASSGRSSDHRTLMVAREHLGFAMLALRALRLPPVEEAK